MTRIPALLPAVVGVAALGLVACSAPAPIASVPSAAPSPMRTGAPRFIAVMDAPYSDITVLQADKAGEWTVHTEPTRGDSVAVRAAIDSNDDGTNDPYGDVAAVMSQTAHDNHSRLTLVLSPDESEVWSVTPAQAAAHPDLEPVNALVQ